MNPTWTRRRPNSTSAFITRKAAASDVTSGFSQKTGLPGGDARKKLLLVRGAPGADHHRLHPVRANQRLGLVEDVGTFGRRSPGAIPVYVADRDDLAPGEHLGETADVVLANHP